AEPVAHHARGDVRRASRRDRDHDPDRLHRILRLCKHRHSERQRAREQAEDRLIHGLAPASSTPESLYPPPVREFPVCTTMAQGRDMETTSAWRWASLGGVDPLALTSARRLAHRAAQWATRAARANLPAAADDSHSALTWKASERALLSAALGGTGGDARVGVRLNPLDLVFAADDDFGSMLPLRELSDGEAQMWLDTALARRGLKKAGGVALPYEVEGDDPRARYAAERERPGLAE